MDLPTRAEAVTILRDARARTVAQTALLTDEQLERPSTIGDGDWSAKDLLGHLTSWEELALAWIETGAPPDPAPPGTDEFNARNVAVKRERSLDRIKEESARTHAALLAAIEAMDDEHWRAEVEAPGRDRAELGRVIGFVLAGDEHGLFAHDRAHHADLEVYVESCRPGFTTASSDQ